MKTTPSAWLVLGGLCTALSCTPRVSMDPIRVEPIHITMDVQVKVDRQLDRFFDFEEKATADVSSPEQRMQGVPES